MCDKPNDDTPIVLEPLMPGEDAPYKPDEQCTDHKDGVDRIEDILIREKINQGKTELKESRMQRDALISMAVLLVLFFFSMEFLPAFLAIPVILAFSVIKVRSSMKKKSLDLKEAVNDNIVLVLLTGLFVYLAFLNIVDRW